MGRIWLAYSRHCALIETQVPFDCFFYMDPLTINGGPRCYLRLSKMGPLWGPTGKDSAVFGPP